MLADAATGLAVARRDLDRLALGVGGARHAADGVREIDRSWACGLELRGRGLRVASLADAEDDAEGRRDPDGRRAAHDEPSDRIGGLGDRRQRAHLEPVRQKRLVDHLEHAVAPLDRAAQRVGPAHPGDDSHSAGRSSWTQPRVRYSQNARPAKRP